MATGIDILDFDNDDARFQEGGIWYPNAANFPACVMLFHEDDIANGAATWTDRINTSLVLNAATTFTKDANGVSGAVAATPLTGDVLPVIGDNYPALIWQGQMLTTAASVVQVGDPQVTDGIEVNGRTSSSLFVTPPGSAGFLTHACTGSHSFPVTGCCTMYADTDNSPVDGESHRFVSSNDGAINYTDTSSAKTTPGANDTWAAFSANTTLVIPVGGGAKIIALFSFDVSNEPDPLLIAAGNLWMAANPGKLYPGFAGKT